jgi:superfamily II DNA or RNA helicase
MSENNIYPDLKINGRLFPLWILKNYKKYKLEPIIKAEGIDPCNIVRSDNIKELRKYQQFVGSYLDFRSPYKEILLYHGLGSGKTAAAINVYNMLYNYNPNWNVFILIKRSLKDDPWLKDLKSWLKKRDEQMTNIKFIHYDAPNANKKFLEAVKSIDIQKKNIYIFDEAHNFIRNVYNNIITKKGNRAYAIYDYIRREKKENNNTRIILISGTPAVNTPFELALIFNLLRPDIFPMKEINFNELYIDQDNFSLNYENKNMFQRRILGLVSYYYGSTSDLFAQKNIIIKKIPMDKYHQEIYEYYEDIEIQLEKKQRGKSTTKTYKSYTRQASNFVFPIINKFITGDNRPRPSKFKIEERDAEKLLEGNLQEKNENILLYTDTIKKFITALESYFIKIHNKDIDNKHTIYDDIEIFKTNYKFKFKDFWINHKNKSNLLLALYSCSCKMTAILFYMMRSKGPILMYSNYVKMEGLEIFKIYLRCIGFNEYDKEKTNNNFLAYIEFHGEIDFDIRVKNLLNFNQDKNIDGSIIRVILISPAGSEGISLMNVRQVHILEPYWNEVRIEQLIGRAIRQCSHKLLPIEERTVDVFRYLVTRTDVKNIRAKIETTDENIYNLAISKYKLIQSFLDIIKETAVDCELFKEHNMIDKKYNCFKFNEKSYFEGNFGPAYKEDIYYDKKLDNGSNSINSEIKKIKVIEINAVYKINDEFSDVDKYWYNPTTGIVYDDLDYPIGKVFEIDGVPNKLNKDTYIIDDYINIPEINVL